VVAQRQFDRPHFRRWMQTTPGSVWCNGCAISGFITAGEIRRFRPAIVHTHLAKAGFAGRIAARLARVPAVVHTYHGHVFHGYFPEHAAQLLVRVERLLARWTDRIVVLSECQKREILDYGIGTEARMECVPLGLELGPFAHASQRKGELTTELGIEEGVRLVGIVARLVPIKAHEVFLRAAARVASGARLTQFVVVGDGELRRPLEELSRDLGLHVCSHGTGANLHGAPCPRAHSSASHPVVHFLGFRSDLERIYADLDVVVLCSRNEGLPVSIIEALAAARPVVATSVGAVEDLIAPDETGLLVRSDDAEALASAVAELLSQPTWAARMAKRGQERVLARYTAGRLERDLRSLYATLAKTHPGSAGDAQAPSTTLSAPVAEDPGSPRPRGIFRGR
jgi:glycosyltransferase involved in cell wall biosynthesis